MSRMSNLHYIKAFTITLTAGTPVQGTDYQVPAGVSVIVMAGQSNTGTVTVASTSATAINSSTDNFPLAPGDGVSVQVQNTNDLWVDSTVTGDTARVMFEYEPVV